MTARVLPPDEWHRLEGTPLGEVWRTLPTTGLTILVVETRGGEIIAHWTFFQCLHAEQVWVAPEHRKRAAVARQLLGGMRTIADERHATAFITHSASADVTQLLGTLGATRLPGEAFTVPVKGV